jgi:hypothetical protein
MSLLRRLSTARLLALCVGILAVLAAGTAIATGALRSDGTPPPAKPLAAAVHDALAKTPVEGVTARISFTNHLIAGGAVQGSDPILSGASGRLWAAKDGRLRLELQAESDRGGDVQAVVGNGRWWVYDSGSNTVYRGTLPAHKDAAAAAGAPEKHHAIPTLQQIQDAITHLMRHVDVSGAQPGVQGGQGSYSVRIGPKQNGGLIGGAELAWDAATGAPLRISVYARGNASPVLELAATHISYGTVSSSALDIAPPTKAKVVDVALPTGGAGDHAGSESKGARAKTHTAVSGLAAVQAKLPFKISAPDSLAGQPRREIRLAGHGGVLVTYGEPLGGVAVIERAAKPGAKAPVTTSNGDRGGLSLPTFAVSGATATELPTALGTGVSFVRGGVEYLLVGSVTKATAEAAAKGL